MKKTTPEPPQRLQTFVNSFATSVMRKTKEKLGEDGALKVQKAFIGLAKTFKQAADEKQATEQEVQLSQEVKRAQEAEFAQLAKASVEAHQHKAPDIPLTQDAVCDDCGKPVELEKSGASIEQQGEQK